MRLIYPSICALLFSHSLAACGDDDNNANTDGGSDAQVFMDGKVTRNDGGMLMMDCPGGCEEGKECMAGKCVAVGVQKKCGCVDGDAGDGETCYPEYGVFSDDATVLFVKKSDTNGDGSLESPFSSISAALTKGQEVDAAAGGDKPDIVIAVAAGEYDENLTISGIANPILAGACAEQTRIVGEIHFQSGIDNAGLTGCTVTAPTFDPSNPSWPSEEVCNSENPTIGVQIAPGASSTALQITESVIEGFCTGVYLNSTGGAQLCLANSRVCANEVGVDIKGAASTVAGTGACLLTGYGASIQQSIIDQNRTYGIKAGNDSESLGFIESALLLTGKLGEDGPSQQLSADLAYGFYLTNLRDALITASTIENNGGVGLSAIDLPCPTENLVCPEGAPGCADEDKVCNLAALDNTIEISGNEVLNNMGAGIALQQLLAVQPAQISGNLISSTSASASVAGDGLQVSVRDGTSFDVSVLNNFIDLSARDGVLLDGVGGTIDGNTISASGEYGILLQNSDALIQTNTISGSGTLDENVTTEIVHDAINIPPPMP